MRDYFDAEMRLLHEAGREFAEAYPEQARMLNMGELRDRDPYIERLLEGVAFLTAHIRQRIDGAQTAISEQVLAHVCPQQINIFPSATIVEFRAEPHRQTACTIPAGTELLSEPVGKYLVACRFRTVADVRVLPLAIDSVTAEERTGGLTRLRLGLRVEGATPLAQLDLDELPLYLHADPALSAVLYQALCEQVRAVRVHYEAEGKPQVAALGGGELLEPLHAEPGAGELTGLAHGHPGYELLHSYFCFRDKFMFVRLSGLGRVAWPEDCTRFELELDCELSLPVEHKLEQSHFRLHCAPAVNLFADESDPVEVDHHRAEYRLVADGRRREEVHIYAVHAVVGREHRSSVVHEYQPLYGLRRRRDGERYFHAFRRDQGMALPATYLSIGGGQELESETLSCRITASNGHLPRQYLHVGDIRVPSANVPSGVRFGNLTRPSPVWEPPQTQEYPWRLQALLALNVGSLARVDALRQLLELFEWTGRRDNRRRIEGISGVESRPVNRVIQGMLHRGMEVTVTLDEACFLSTADAYLFGRMLHGFWLHAAGLNEFVQTRIVCQPSYQEFLWAPRLGRSSPL